MKRSNFARVVSSFFLCACLGAAACAPEEPANPEMTVSAATQTVTFKTFPRATCTLHAPGTSLGARIGADEDGVATFTIVPDASGDRGGPSTRSISVEADCQAGDRTASYTLHAPVVPLPTARPEPPPTTTADPEPQPELQAAGSLTLSDHLVGRVLPFLGTPFMASTVTFVLPSTFGRSGLAAVTDAGISTALATSRGTSAAVISVNYTNVPGLGQVGTATAVCNIARGSGTTYQAVASIPIREGDQFRLDTWFGTSSGAYKWDGGYGFCQFKNLTLGRTSRVGPVSLAGLDTSRARALFGITKGPKLIGGGWNSLTGWDPHLVMTSAVALLANGPTMSGGVSSADEYQMYSDNSPTSLDAVVQVWDDGLHFIWNWYD